MLGAKGAKIVPTVKHIIINISIFLAPTRSDNLPIMTVMTAPETMYAVITQDAKASGNLKVLSNTRKSWGHRSIKIEKYHNSTG